MFKGLRLCYDAHTNLGYTVNQNKAFAMNDRHEAQFQRMQDDQEAAGTAACEAAAAAQGLPHGAAETCDDGEHKCEQCPWRERARG